MADSDAITESTSGDAAAATVDAATAEVVVAAPAPSAPPPAGLLQAAGGTIPRARVPGALITHGGITIDQFFGTQLIGLLFPMAAGVLLYGWRAIVVIAVVLAAALAATTVWRRVGWRGQHLRYPHVAWLAVLLAMTLPAHLASMSFAVNNSTVTPWPILVAAGIFLAIFVWLLGGMGSGRVHPVLVTFLLVFVWSTPLMVPHFVLQRSHTVVGDLLKSTDLSDTSPAPPVALGPAPTMKEPWNSVQQVPGYDSVRSEPASQRLTFYTTGLEWPEGAFLSLEALLRDHMPPLEDLILGASPAPIGAGCIVAIIIGGLFLLYRGMIDFRIPLFIFVAAYLGLLVLPVPVIIHPPQAGEWRWLAIRDPSVGWPLALTFANYEVMASPLLFTAFFLATAPSVRPLARRARVVYAILIGLAAAAGQLYLSVAIGPYIAMLAVSLLTPFLDRWFTARTLV